MNWSAPKIVVCASEPGCIAEADRLAQSAGLALAKITEPPDSSKNSESSSWTLLVKPSELSLIRPDGLSIEIDFIRGKANRRAGEANFSTQPIARALGLKPFRKQTDRLPTVIDATAGFGTDGWMIASLGCTIQLLEVSPVLATMLEHALNNARRAEINTVSDAAAAHRRVDNPAHQISVINTNSVQFLNNEDNAGADIVYLDPMYPPTRSKALVKKGMQLLHDLIGPDNNSDELLSAALSKAKYRVVVKRPRSAPQLQSAHCFAGQISTVQSPNTRFDIYHLGSV